MWRYIICFIIEIMQKIKIAVDLRSAVGRPELRREAKPYTLSRILLLSLHFVLF
jgi:hypothetical protein